MSTPDEPTRRIPASEPHRPGTPPPREREREVIADDSGWRADVADQLRSIRNALFGVGLIALLGLALGVYLLVTRDDDANSGSAASASQVRDLDNRVEELESQAGEGPSESDLNDIEQSQSQLEDRLEALEQQAGDDDGEDTQQLQQAIEDLTSKFEQLSERVDSLEQQQQQQDQP